MPLSVYLVGAGLTKSLELEKRVPLMWDFVSVMAEYIENDVVLNTLVTLERSDVFTAKCELCRTFAMQVRGEMAAVSAQERAHFAALLKGRPTESIEDLLSRASTIERSSPGFAWASGAPIYFTYGINQLFASINWDLNLTVVEKFLTERFTDKTQSHAFVNFNYDLALDKAVERTSGGEWQPRDGYGFEFPAWTAEDPSSSHPNSAVQAFGAECLALNGPRISILKPHGSLNWLRRRRNTGEDNAAGPAEMLLPLDKNMTIRYWMGPHTFNYVSLGGDLPRDYEIVIAPPTPDKQPIMKKTVRQEAEALQWADEIFILGYSLPKTDTDQRDLIRRAVSENKSIRRVIVVNCNAPEDYFEDMRELFECPETEEFNNGFFDFANHYSALSANTRT